MVATKKDPFELVMPVIGVWLEENPEYMAKQLLIRLQNEFPGQFPISQLRTLRRRIKNWRLSRLYPDAITEKVSLSLQKIVNESVPYDSEIPMG
jgi:hypothetical protein